MTGPTIASRDAWLVARRQLLEEEKELTRRRDAVSRRRRELPWVRVTKPYAFDGPHGRETLADLFGGCSQLIVYHFMFAPGWQEGCKICSLLADQFDGMIPHLRARDVALAVVSRAPLEKLQAFQARMGWRFKWLSSVGSDFGVDHHVSFPPGEIAPGEATYNYEKVASPGEEMPGASVFARDAGGEVFHTYSCYARGLDALMAPYPFLDLVPKGRDEGGLPAPMAWIRHHDRYAG
jgi:predicted dithiol-disulfide oxidoreductase (DUF899 family)